ncbi:MAG: lipopolysaccharide transport periplasmic protein LptA [Gammaproteobacteria bacterium]|nr:lipopolysaccharide transport periplasmic protein LptA [Gammaproteobacteria bacterium]
MRPILSALLTLLAACCAAPAFALSSDKEQPINVEADSVEIDHKQGVSVYKGNVTLTQGSIHLDADIVTLYSRNNDIEKAFAEGKPAHYRQRPDGKQEDVRAQSQRMEYYTGTGKLILLEGAHVWQEQNQFSGNRIEYDVERSVVNASMAKSGKERVRVIIQPKKKSSGPAPPTQP